MSVENNKTLYRRYVAAIFGKDLAILNELLAPDFVGHDLPPGMPPGPEGLRQFRRVVDAAFPDLEGRIEDLVVESDRVVGRVTLQGTHRGEFMGIPATGRRVQTELIEIVRVERGKLAEPWVKRDRLSELQQLGAAPVPGQPPQADTA